MKSDDGFYRPSPATNNEIAPGNSPPELGGVSVSRRTGWLSPEAASIKSQSAPPPTPSSTEEGSCVSRQQDTSSL